MAIVSNPKTTALRKFDHSVFHVLPCLGRVFLIVFFLFRLEGLLENPDAVTEILNNAELLKQIVYCIGGENLSVAKTVSQLQPSPKRSDDVPKTERPSGLRGEG